MSSWPLAPRSAPTRSARAPPTARCGRTRFTAPVDVCRDHPGRVTRFPSRPALPVSHLARVSRFPPSAQSDWNVTLEAALGPKYVRLRSDTLGQMRLVLFARIDVFPAVDGHESMSEATGVGHVGSNKGGIATAVWVWDTSVCFLNSHLAAHQGKTARRNSDYKEVRGAPTTEPASGARLLVIWRWRAYPCARVRLQPALLL